MSKLCSSELRTGPLGGNFEFTGEHGELANINISAVRVLARKLADRAGQNVVKLDAEGNEAYQQLSHMIKRYQNTGRPYQEIYDAIIEEFAGVTNIGRGTVAEVFLSCSRSSGCGSRMCNPACMNSLLRPPEDVGKPCDVNTFSIDERNNLSIVGARVHNSSTASIYIQHNGQMTEKIIAELRRSGISQVTIYRIESNGVCSPMYEGRTMNLNDVLGGKKSKRKCLWGNCESMSAEEDTSGMWYWIWAIIVLIIFIIIVVLIVILVAWLMRKSAKNANENPTSCTSFQRGCAKVYNKIC